VTRDQLEHVIRAAATIAREADIVVVGSQAILGQYPNAPSDLLVSAEADIYPRGNPDRADLIDGSIGELSPFHDTFGYFAHGIGPETATLPQGWEERLVPIRLETATGWCIEVHDLLVSKYAAGREKDREFVRAVLRHRLADVATVLTRLMRTSIPEPQQRFIEQLVRADAASC
jgi:hypothetical protein